MRGKQGRIRRQRSAVVVMEKLIETYDGQIAHRNPGFKENLLKKKEKAKKCLKNTLSNLKSNL
tara:strand:+ start:775 stop:963 length:189 start_codon:yes stop_codon:yes gene_type:complete